MAEFKSSEDTLDELQGGLGAATANAAPSSASAA